MPNQAKYLNAIQGHIFISFLLNIRPSSFHLFSQVTSGFSQLISFLLNVTSQNFSDFSTEQKEFGRYDKPIHSYSQNALYMCFPSTPVLTMNVTYIARRRRAMGQGNGTAHKIFIHPCAVKATYFVIPYWNQCSIYLIFRQKY